MIYDKFKITGKTCVITGGAGLLGQKHAEAVIEGEGIPILLDISEAALNNAQTNLKKQYPSAEIGVYRVDITKQSELEIVRDELVKKYGRIDILINMRRTIPKLKIKEITSEIFGLITSR